MQIDVNGAVARMSADIETAFELFGSAASNRALLAKQLAKHSGDPPHVGGVSASGSAPDWVARAAHLITEVGTGSEVAVRQCTEQAFDDTDARVRGLAWCALAEMQDNEVTQGMVNAIIANEFKRRVSEPGSYPERDNDADAFAVLVSATVSYASAGQTLKGLEREYIDANGGSDASAMQSSLSAALDFLQHRDADRRLAALRVVARAAKGEAEAKEAVWRVIVSDPEFDVRLAAIVAYTDIFADTFDTECLRRAAELVLDDRLPALQRYAAYCGLLKVCGRRHNSEFPMHRADDETLAHLHESAFEVNWLVAVDWDFVRRCAQGNGS